MKPFLSALKDRVLVCDGAMGTMLYARGVFINRSFDALNVAQPDLVAEVHQEYVRAGADIIETNTFGANRIKLGSFGLADKLHAINAQGARIARHAAREQAYVAGSIGPLGIRIEPWGKTGVDEAHAYFREQAQALLEGGVDLFILETFRDVNEIGAAIDAVRSVTDLPILAQMTTEDDGSTLDGTPPERFAPELERRGATLAGVNCSVGPASMLETIERMAAVTRLRLAAQPNAGRPRDVEGRNLYLCSPEYMASYARRFILHNVRVVGGCCGTTPEHIRSIKAAVQTLAAGSARVRAERAEGDRLAAAERPGAHGRAPGGATGGTRPAASPRPSPPAASVSAQTPAITRPLVPRAEKSGLARALDGGSFVLAVEVRPPRGHVCDRVLEGARTLGRRGIDVVTIPDGQRSGARISALSLAVLIQQGAGVETVLHYSCRDRNLIGIQSDLLGAHALGLRNLLLITGDPTRVGDYPDATAVFDVDSIGLTNVVARLNQGCDIGGQPIGAPTGYHIGVSLNPAAPNVDEELRRFEFKVQAGAEFVITRPVFDVPAFEALLRRLEPAKLPVLAGVVPFESVRQAELMANEMPGVQVPRRTLDRMRAAAEPTAAAAEGLAIARETAAELRAMVHGLHVSTLSGDVETALAVLDGLR